MRKIRIEWDNDRYHKDNDQIMGMQEMIPHPKKKGLDQNRTQCDTYIPNRLGTMSTL